jgi:hypothetical protein
LIGDMPGLVPGMFVLAAHCCDESLDNAATGLAF